MRPSMAISTLLLLPALYTFQTQGKVLLVHNVEFFQVIFSQMINQIKQIYKEVDISTVDEIVKTSKSVYQYKNPQYQLVIMMAPTSDKVLQAAEKLELFKFYDEGNKIIFMGDLNPSPNWKILISQFGFDQTSSDIDPKDLLAFSNQNHSKQIFISKNEIKHLQFSKGLIKGIVYEGGPISLSPYENSISWSLLESPQDVLFLGKGVSSQVFDQNKMNLVAGAQGPKKKTRCLIIGSFKMFTNKLNRKSFGDNIGFFRNMLRWVNFESNVLKISNLEICDLRNKNCEFPLKVSTKNGLFLKFQIYDENNQFYSPAEKKIYVQFIKQTTYLNKEPELKNINGEYYYYYELKNIDQGLYRIQIRHYKPGYYIDTVENEKLVTAQPPKINSIELFKLEGVPFLIIIFVVFFSAMNLMRITLKNKEN